MFFLSFFLFFFFCLSVCTKSRATEDLELLLRLSLSFFSFLVPLFVCPVPVFLFVQNSTYLTPKLTKYYTLYTVKIQFDLIITQSVIRESGNTQRATFSGFGLCVFVFACVCVRVCVCVCVCTCMSVTNTNWEKMCRAYERQI